MSRSVLPILGLAALALGALIIDWSWPNPVALRLWLDEWQGPLEVFRMGLYIVVVGWGPVWCGAHDEEVRRIRWALLAFIAVLELSWALSRG